MAGALCRRRPERSTCRPTWPRTAPRCAGSRELFPEARSYLDVYARAGLLHRARVLAHGIWLDDADRAALRDSGAQIAHCPSSQPVPRQRPVRLARRARRPASRVSLASDVGGGTSLSMLRTLADAYKVQALAGAAPDRLEGAARRHARRGARRCGLDDEIGTPRARPHGRPVRLGLGRRPGGRAPHGAWRASLHEQVFAWMTLADERNLVRPGSPARTLPRPTPG